MSASTEKLLEQIKQVEEELCAAKISGNTIRIIALESNLRNLCRALNSANEALSEGKQILKG
jgi:hypothetical protein